LQSAPKSRPGTFTILEMTRAGLDESPATLRRRWSAEAKAQIVEEAMTPGANVSAVARAHGVSPQQLFAWRRKAIRSGAIAILPARSEVRTQSFAPVEVTAGDGGRVVGLEIVIGDATIRVGDGVAPILLVEVIRALRSA
jgi:transposase